MTIKEQYARYAELERELTAVQQPILDEMGAIKTVLVQDLLDNPDARGKNSLDTDDGIFYITRKKNWTYTDAFKESVNKMKRAEEDMGTATSEESISLTYRKN